MIVFVIVFQLNIFFNFYWETEYTLAINFIPITLSMFVQNFESMYVHYELY